MENRNADKKIYIQIAGAIAALAVIFMHANDCFWNFSLEGWWIAADIIENVAYFAVPVFFMISGVTLMDYRQRYSTKEYFKKRILKTVVPFTIWSVIGMLWCLIIEKQQFTGVKNMFINLLNTKYVGVYWFFIPLFTLYLAIPFLSLIPEESRKNGFGYAIIAITFFNCALPFISELTGFDYNYALYFPVVTGFADYLLVGYWIDHYEIRKKFRMIIYASAVVSAAIMVVGTLLASYKAGEVVETFKGYSGILCMIYSGGVFLFFKNIKSEKVLNGLGKIAGFFSPLTFGIYLIHWYILRVITKLSPIPNTSLVFRLIAPIIIFLLSGLIVWVMKKIPVIKRIVP